MRATRPGLLLALTALCIALAPGPAEARMYRWVDDEGHVHYTDRIPPSEVEKGHSELTEQGIRIQEVAPAPTQEELLRERELERLRNEQQRLIEEQRTADRVLLRTYRSVDDLTMARNGKLAAIDVLIGVARGNIRRQQDWLNNLRGDAANQERAGKPVPRHLIESIEKSERSIRHAYAGIVAREREKEQVNRDFDRDLKRFRLLNDIPEDRAEPQVLASRPVLSNLVTCSGAEQCSLYWSRAVAFVNEHATTQLQTSSSNLLMTAPPATPEDVSLTLSLVREQDSDLVSLFLDARCRNRGSSDPSCTGERTKQVLAGFRDAVIGGTDPQAAPPAEPPVPPATTAGRP